MAVTRIVRSCLIRASLAGCLVVLFAGGLWAQGGNGLIDTNTPNVMILLPSIIVFISDNHRLSPGFCLKVRRTSQITPFSTPIPQPAKIFTFFKFCVKRCQHTPREICC